MARGSENPIETMSGGAVGGGERWRRLGARLVDVALPPQCLACRTRVSEAGGLCASCWSQLQLIEQPVCRRLGTPMAYEEGPDSLSAEAIADPPKFDRCRSVAVFDDIARRLVHGLKYRDELELAAWIGRWMARAGAELLADADLIAPVPLHRRRLWGRRYNQAALLGAELSRAGAVPMVGDALVRPRATRQQVGLSTRDRARNVRGAFRVTQSGERLVHDRRVLVVDDVFTTGATLNASARALLQAGAASVDALVFARVVRGRS